MRTGATASVITLVAFVVCRKDARVVMVLITFVAVPALISEVVLANFGQVPDDWACPCSRSRRLRLGFSSFAFTSCAVPFAALSFVVLVGAFKAAAFALALPLVTDFVGW